MSDLSLACSLIECRDTALSSLGTQYSQSVACYKQLILAICSQSNKGTLDVAIQLLSEIQHLHDGMAEMLIVSAAVDLIEEGGVR